jgi:ElaB/YqjD/DUF883 family membrane-anchored ribosome-binding protein
MTAPDAKISNASSRPSAMTSRRSADCCAKSAKPRLARKRDAALAEAEALLDRSRAILDEGRTRAKEATASIEDHIREKPVQSALVALGVGFLVGIITRR